MSFFTGRLTRAMQEDVAENKARKAAEALAAQASRGAGVDYADGDWIAMSMGQFIQILVDSGLNASEAILFRVVSDTPVDDESFMRQMDVLQVPSGAVAQQITERNARVHKVLAGFLKAGKIE